MNVDITIADGVTLNTSIDAGSAGSTTSTIGDNVTLQKFDGSSNGIDTVIIGHNFATSKDFKTNGGDDTITIGSNATAPKFDAGADCDTVVTNDPN